MKRNIISLVPLFLLIGACAPHVSGFGLAKGNLPTKKVCKAPVAMPVCTDAQYNKKSVLTITVNKSQVVVAPKTVCVMSPGEITVNVHFTGRPTRNSVRTVPKDIADLWLFGDNRRKSRKFTLVIDDTIATGNYDFGVATVDSGCIDPRISVKKT